MPEVMVDLGGQDILLERGERLWTLREVAEFLRVSPATIRRWTKSGSLPFYRPGGKGRRLFSPQHIRAFLAKCEQGKRP